MSKAEKASTGREADYLRGELPILGVGSWETRSGIVLSDINHVKEALAIPSNAIRQRVLEERDQLVASATSSLEYSDVWEGYIGKIQGTGVTVRKHPKQPSLYVIHFFGRGHNYINEETIAQKLGIKQALESETVSINLDHTSSRQGPTVSLDMDKVLEKMQGVRQQLIDSEKLTGEEVVKRLVGDITNGTRAGNSDAYEGISLGTKDGVEATLFPGRLATSRFKKEYDRKTNDYVWRDRWQTQGATFIASLGGLWEVGLDSFPPSFKIQIASEGFSKRRNNIFPAYNQGIEETIHELTSDFISAFTPSSPLPRS